MLLKNKSIPNGDYLIRVFPGASTKSFIGLSEDLERSIENLKKGDD